MSLSVNMNENQMLHKQVFLSGGMQILKFKDKMLQKQEFLRAIFPAQEKVRRSRHNQS